MLPLVVAEMEQIHLNFGRVKLDLRTLFEGLLYSGLVLVLSLWLSAGIEHSILTQTVSDLSMRKVAANLLRAVILLSLSVFANIQNDRSPYTIALL